MIFFNIQRRNEHKEMKPYANKLQGRVYMCRRFTTATDRRKLIDIPPVYTIHVDNSQHTERACFPYFLSAYIRLCHCLESFYIYVQPFYLKCLLHFHENWRNLNIDV